MQVDLDWSAIRDDGANALAGAVVEVAGWAMPLDVGVDADDGCLDAGSTAIPSANRLVDYCVLSADAPCCGGHVPRNPLSSIEVFMAAPLLLAPGAVRLRGRLVRLVDDPAGWRYQLVEARLLQSRAVPAVHGVSRRVFLASTAALGLAACAQGRFPTDSTAAAASPSPAANPPAWQPAAGALTIDLHSHEGHIIFSRRYGVNRPFIPVAAPMRAGGMNVICLAIVTDTAVTTVDRATRRIHAERSPQPGELHALGQIEFARARALIAHEQLGVVTNAATLAASGHARPSVIIACEGADFLEGRIDRVDEAYTLHQLRHLQLTHYRVNELGDIQTEPPVHGGLTDFGADVVRRCNALGIVVDVAHGTLDLVKRAAATTTRPLVLSHTALAAQPGPRSRSITVEHARVIASTGGVIGIWPSSGSFVSLSAMAQGMKRLADIVGVAHVGLGTDMRGLTSPGVFESYELLPALATALLSTGFSQDDVGAVLGGNYRRVFEATAG